jgi:hypothetical protein
VVRSFPENDAAETLVSQVSAYDEVTPKVTLSTDDETGWGRPSPSPTRVHPGPNVGSPATTGATMTETHEHDTITEALSIIDRALGEMLHRELVSTDEVSNLLLDVRTLLTTEDSALAQN